MDSLTHVSPWRIDAYRRLWLSTVIISLAVQAERLVFGWLVLIETDSVFLTAATFAIQKAPISLVAPIAGAICDRIPRKRILILTAVFRALIMILMALLTFGGLEQLWLFFVLVALSGIGPTFEVPATQGLITDIVDPQMSMRAVALQSTGSRAVGALGSLVGGLAIASFGVTAALAFAGIVFLIGAGLVTTLPTSKTSQIVSDKIDLGIVLEAVKGLNLLLRLPIVRTILLMAFIVEMFAFAYNAVLPSVARDVLKVEADGLGTLSLMTGLGGVIGVAILATIGQFSRKGPLLIGVTTAYGAILIAFALSELFPLSLILVMGIGSMAAMFDALQWTLLQQHVPDEMRGRAIGSWMFAIGFGWIGQLMLGAVAEATTVQWALSGTGLLVVLTGFVVFVRSPNLRLA